MATDTTPTHLIRAINDGGFRRGGRAWSTTPTEVVREDFDARQWAEIEAEPELTVQRIDAPSDSPAPAAPGGADIADIVAAINRLDPVDKSAWTAGGKPQVAALEKIIGRDISAADRDTAWAQIPVQRI